jgi:hypothetical protein
MNITVISTYRFDLEESFKNILCSSLKDLGHNVGYLNGLIDKPQGCAISDLKKIKADMCMIIAQPKKIKQIITNIQTRYIIYNLESVSKSNEYSMMISEAMIGKMAHKLCTYSESQLRLFRDAVFLPVGFHNSLCVGVEKLYPIDKACFVGGVREHRLNTIKNIASCGLNVDVLNKGREVGYAAREAGKYIFGIDIDEFPDQIEKHRWHRLMVYAANRVVFMTTTDWSKYGFIDGVHYIKCNSTKDFYTKSKSCDPDTVSKNMYDLVSTKFAMSKLLKDTLEL